MTNLNKITNRRVSKFNAVRIFLFAIALLSITSDQSQAGVLRDKCVKLITKLYIKKGKHAEAAKDWTQAYDQANASTLRQNEVQAETLMVIPLWRLKSREPLKSLTQSLDDLAKSGVSEIYLPPVLPQSVYNFFGSVNRHGYWPKSFSPKQVDRFLGNPEDFTNLIKAAKERGMQTTADINIRHIGYAPADGIVDLWGHEAKIDDKNFFFQYPAPTKTEMIKESINGGIEMEDIRTKRAWFGLPPLNFDNPWVLNNIIKDHLDYVNMGITHFRIDAAKHIDSIHLKAILGALATRIAEVGGKPKFILEYLSGNYREIALKIASISPVPGLFAIDTPLSLAVRQTSLDEGSFKKLTEPIKSLEDIDFDQRFLIPQVTDLDNYYPRFYDGSEETGFKTLTALVLANFLSANRPLFVSGIEQPLLLEKFNSDTRNNELFDKFIDSSSPLYGDFLTLNHYLNKNFGELEPLSSMSITQAEDDFITIERKIKNSDRSVFVCIDRSKHQEGFKDFSEEHDISSTVIHKYLEKKNLTLFIGEGRVKPKPVVAKTEPTK